MNLKIKNRSLMSKEKFADSLMAVANTVHGAVLVSVFVFPLTAFLTAIFANAAPFSFLTIIHGMTWPNISIFALVYLAPILVGVYAKKIAMDLYDEVTKSPL